MRTGRHEAARAFGQALKTARRGRGISQEQLAEFGDFDRTTKSKRTRLANSCRLRPALSSPSALLFSVYTNKIPWKSSSTRRRTAGTARNTGCRWLGIAPQRDKLYAVVFTVREDETMRIISVRPATNSEVRRYETQGCK